MPRATVLLVDLDKQAGAEAASDAVNLDSLPSAAACTISMLFFASSTLLPMVLDGVDSSILGEVDRDLELGPGAANEAGIEEFEGGA